MQSAKLHWVSLTLCSSVTSSIFSWMTLSMVKILYLYEEYKKNPHTLFFHWCWQEDSNGHPWKILNHPSLRCKAFSGLVGINERQLLLFRQGIYIKSNHLLAGSPFRSKDCLLLLTVHASTLWIFTSGGLWWINFVDINLIIS